MLSLVLTTALATTPALPVQTVQMAARTPIVFGDDSGDHGQNDHDRAMPRRPTNMPDNTD
jgi:hypothetical protein